MFGSSVMAIVQHHLRMGLIPVHDLHRDLPVCDIERGAYMLQHWIAKAGEIERSDLAAAVP